MALPRFATSTSQTASVPALSTASCAVLRTSRSASRTSWHRVSASNDCVSKSLVRLLGPSVTEAMLQNVSGSVRPTYSEANACRKTSTESSDWIPPPTCVRPRISSSNHWIQTTWSPELEAEMAAVRAWSTLPTSVMITPRSKHGVGSTYAFPTDVPLSPRMHLSMASASSSSSSSTA